LRELGGEMGTEFTEFHEVLRGQANAVDQAITAIREPKATPLTTAQRWETFATAPQPTRTRLRYESEDSDTGSDEEVLPEAPHAVPVWSHEDEDELLRGIPGATTAPGSLAKASPEEDEVEMTDAAPVALFAGTASPSRSRGARARRNKAEGLEASKFATPGAGVHPDSARQIAGIPATPPTRPP